MRVLLLTNMFPPHAHGGYELWARDVARLWSGHGHEVLVLTSDVALEDVIEEPAGAGVEVRRDLKLYWQDHRILEPPLWRRLGMERRNHRILAAAIEAFRPDVVSAWAMGAMSMTLLRQVQDLGIPLVCVVCDEWPSYGPVVDAWVRLFPHRPRLGRAVHGVTGMRVSLPDLDRAQAVCFVSEAMRQKVAVDSPWHFEHAAVVPSGIDPADFPLTGPRSTPWRWRLLHVGRIDARKGIGTVIDAMARLPGDATLEVLGSGDAEHLDELQALATALGVDARVQFGIVARRELAARYRSADAVVFAPVWDEPFGLVPIEAMACATPVVASPTGGSTEFLIPGTNCIAFAPGDAEGLAGALTLLGQDPELRARLVRGGLATAARYDAPSIAARLEQIHLKAITG
ncbi:MAG: glycosyltransferase family 4 protein [Acidimicrobiales bacterium]